MGACSWLCKAVCSRKLTVSTKSSVFNLSNRGAGALAPMRDLNPFVSVPDLASCVPRKMDDRYPEAAASNNQRSQSPWTPAHLERGFCHHEVALCGGQHPLAVVRYVHSSDGHSQPGDGGGRSRERLFGVEPDLAILGPNHNVSITYIETRQICSWHGMLV